jgi:hypothetical protein
LFYFDSLFLDEEGLREFVSGINKRLPNAQHWEVYANFELFSFLLECVCLNFVKYFFKGNVMIGRSGNWYTNYSYWKAIQNGKIVACKSVVVNLMFFCDDTFCKDGEHEDLLLVKEGTARFVSRKITHTFPKQKKPRRRGAPLDVDR